MNRTLISIFNFEIDLINFNFIKEILKLISIGFITRYIFITFKILTLINTKKIIFNKKI